MSEYQEVLTDDQAEVATAACVLQTDAMTEVLANPGAMSYIPPQRAVEMQRTVRTLKTVVAETYRDQEMWLDESNILPVCEAIWDVDQFAADAAEAGDAFHEYIARESRALGLVDMALRHRPV